MITTTLTYSTDLDRGVVMTPLHNAFLTGDQEAHRFDVQCYRSRSMEEADMSGAQVNGYFIRADGTTVIIPGTAEGNTVSVALPAACYSRLGRFSLVVKATQRDVTTTVLWVEGAVSRSRTDAVSDPDEVIPNLDALLALVGRLENQVTNIYIGSDTPPEHYNVWIDPAGQATEGDLPPGSAPYQMIVTGPDGVSRWEERTHYDYSGGTVLAPTELKVVGGFTTFTRPFENMPVAGTPYRVTYLTYGYNCTAKTATVDGKECVIIGNQSQLGTGLNTQEPFVFVFYKPEDVTNGVYGWFSCMATDKPTIPAAIEGAGELKKIDKKFLPDDIGGMPQGGEPYKQLVTDGEGNAVWEDRLAYDVGKETKTLVEFTYEGNGKEANNTMLLTEPLLDSIEADETYTVVWNGESHTVTTVFAKSNGVNPDVIVFGGDGYPFSFVKYTTASGGYYGMIVASDRSGHIPVAILQESENVKKIDPKYLPEGIGYEDPNSVTEILPETELSGDGEGFVHAEPLGTTLTAGETYTVTYNGQGYDCTAVDASDLGAPGAVALGNIGLMDGTEGTGEPFILIIVPDSIAEEWGGTVQCVPADGATSVTISISKHGSIHRIPLKYLPEGIGGGGGTVVALENVGEVGSDLGSAFAVYPVLNMEPVNDPYTYEGFVMNVLAKGTFSCMTFDEETGAMNMLYPLVVTPVEEAKVCMVALYVKGAVYGQNVFVFKDTTMFG